MNHYKDLDTLYDFLKSITSIEEFFERKEPDFYDDAAREFAQWSLDHGSDPESVLGALKASERASFAETLKERERKH